MRKLNASIVLGLLAALVGAALVLGYGRHVDRRIAQGRRTAPVLVAEAAAPAGTPLSALAGQVRVAQVPLAYLVPRPIAALGRGGPGSTGQVSLGPIVAGSQLSWSMFGTPIGAATVHPTSGHVALALQAALSPGGAHYIAPGDHVDVFVTYTGAGAGGTDARIADRTKMFLSAVPVLSVSAADPSGRAGTTVTGSAADSSVVTVLDVTPVQAEKLVNATTLGSIYLALAGGVAQRTPAGVVPLDVVTSNG